jgi:hypothetical protein
MSIGIAIFFIFFVDHILTTKIVKAPALCDNISE